MNAGTINKVRMIISEHMPKARRPNNLYSISNNCFMLQGLHFQIEIDILLRTASSFHVMELNNSGTYCMGLELPHPIPLHILINHALAQIIKCLHMHMHSYIYRIRARVPACVCFELALDHACLHMCACTQKIT
jgi:hypothetical protein